MKKKALFLLPCAFTLLQGCNVSEPIAKEAFTLSQWNIYLGNGDPKCIKKALDDLGSDIVFLEECSEVAYSKAITDYVKANEQYVLSERYVDTGECCYVPILFNKEKFEYIDSYSKKFRDGSDVATSKEYSYLVLEKNDSYYCFMNFHGSVCRNKYEGYENYTQEEIDEIANQWRISNVNEVIAKSSELKSTYGEDLQIIIGGDCNFNSESTPYKILANVGFSDSELCSEVVEENSLKTSRNWSSDAFQEGLSIDHVFGNENVSFKSQRYVRSDDVIKGSDHALNYVEIYY